MAQGSQPSREDNLTRLIRLAGDIQEHNNMHSYGAGYGAFVGILLGTACGTEDTKNEPEPKKDPVKSAEQIFENHRHILTEMGFEIMQNPEKYLGLQLSPEIDIQKPSPLNAIAIVPDKITLELIDGDVCVQFLKKIPANAGDRTSANKALCLIASSLDTQLIHTYILKNNGHDIQYWDKFLSTCEGAVSELNRIGAKTEANILGSHLGRVWEGTLKEYVYAERMNVMESPGFKPHNWHTDSTPKVYRSSWDKALEVLERVKENFAANELYETLLEYFKRSVKDAKVDLEASLERDSCPDWHANNCRGMLEVIEDIQLRLDSQ